MRLSDAEARKIFKGKLPAAPVRGKADVRKVRPYDPFDSKTDMVWAKVGAVILQGILGKRIVIVRYHPFIFVLPGESYEIDFLLIAEDGLHYLIECKGSKEAKNYRDARSKLRAAAALHPYWSFALAVWPDQRNEMRWDIEFIK